jgi:DNA-binding transcriptional ArsR family regulator
MSSIESSPETGCRLLCRSAGRVGRPVLILNRRVDNQPAARIFNHMVDQQARLDRLFHALGDRTRRAMLERLAKGEHTVGELAAPYRMSLAAASKHIQTLEKVGLVKRTVRGRIHYCRIDPRPLERADDWLRGYQRLWDTRIDRLTELLRHPDNDDPSPAK